MYIHEFNLILIINLTIVKITKKKQSNGYHKEKKKKPI